MIIVFQNVYSVYLINDHRFSPVTQCAISSLFFFLSHSVPERTTIGVISSIYHPPYLTPVFKYTRLTRVFKYTHHPPCPRQTISHLSANTATIATPVYQIRFFSLNSGDSRQTRYTKTNALLRASREDSLIRRIATRLLVYNMICPYFQVEEYNYQYSFFLFYFCLQPLW